MIKKLDLYILKNFITKVLFLLIIISSIIFLTNFVEMIDNFINAGMSSKEIFNYYIFTMPMFVSYTIPMSVTIGAILTMLAHIKNNELIAIRSLGIGYFRIVTIIIICGFFISIFHFYFENSIVSNSNHKRSILMKQYNLKKNKTKLRNFVEDIDKNKSVIIMNYNNKKEIAKNITIKEIDTKNNIEYRIDAHSMKWNNKLKKWDFKKINLRIWENNILKSQKNITDTSIFLKNITPIYLISEFTLPEEMDYFELNKFIKIKKESSSNTNKWEVGLYHKISYPFSNLFLILFATISAIGLKSSNVSYGIGLSLLIIVIYYILIVIGKNLGIEGSVNPKTSAWIPNTTMLFITFYYYKKYIF